MTREQINVRLSEDARKLLALLASKLGISRTAVIELAIRELAEKKNIRIEK